jgi:hypothetical protein
MGDRVSLSLIEVQSGQQFIRQPVAPDCDDEFASALLEIRLRQ